MTEVERLRLLNAGVGDILEGTEYYSNNNGGEVTGSSTSRIKITAIGEESFICRWDYNCRGIWSEEKGNTTLAFRDWKKI